jgi:hypothetical protein
MDTKVPAPRGRVDYPRGKRAACIESAPHEPVRRAPGRSAAGHRGLRAGAPGARRLLGLHARLDGHPDGRRRVRGPWRGRHLRRRGSRRPAGGGAGAAAGGRVDAGVVLRSRRVARAVAQAAGARAVAAVPRVGLRVDGAGPRAAPGGHVAARGRGSRPAPAALRRLAAPRRAADPRAGRAAPGALPVAALSSSTR